MTLALSDTVVTIDRGSGSTSLPVKGHQNAVYVISKPVFVCGELGGMTKNLYHGIFLNYTGFTVYDGIFFFFHA